MPTAPAATTPGFVGATGPITRRAFAQSILRSMGWPDTPATEAALIAWMASEGTAATWNPFATTYRESGPYAGTPLAGNSAGVQNYPSPEAGIHAFLSTLNANDQKYGPIQEAFARGNGKAAIQAIAASAWGSKPTVALYNQVLTDPSFGDVVVGDGTLKAFGPVPADAGQAVPGLGVDLNPLSWLTDLVGLIGRLFSWDVWKRVLGVLGGVALIGLGIMFIRRDTIAQVSGDVAAVAEVAA